MKTTIDAAGRVVIPSRLRREAGLTAGMLLDVRLENGRIEIEPAPLEVNLERRGRLLVAVPQQGVPVLTAETVEQTRQAVQREHDHRE
jgi:AbrB family looped-hinge helix DNA binding protein